MKSIIKSVLAIMLGRKKYQSFFRKLWKLSILGMNYSSASNYKNNGEEQVIELIDKLFQNRSTLNIFDVGANVGEYSLVLLNKLKSRSINLHIFEPSPTSYSELSRRIPPENGIVLHNTGLSKENKTLTLFSDTRGSKLSSVYKRDIDRAFDNQVAVQMEKLDSVLQHEHIEFLHFLKLDTEGHELDVMTGASDSLSAGRIQVIQFEFGGCNIDSRTYFRDFYKLLCPLYNIYRVVKNGLILLPNYTPELEIFQSSNFLAILRTIDSKANSI